MPRPAFFGLDDRHRRARDGVHVGGDDRVLQRDVFGEARRQIDRFRIAALEHAESRREEEIVEGAAANRGQEIRHAAIIARLISCTPFENAPSYSRRLEPGSARAGVWSIQIRTRRAGAGRTHHGALARGTPHAADHRSAGTSDGRARRSRESVPAPGARRRGCARDHGDIQEPDDRADARSVAGLLLGPAGVAARASHAAEQPMAGARRVHQPRARADLRREARSSPGLAPARRRRPARAASHGAVRRQPVVAARHARDDAARDGDGHAGAGPAAGARRCRRARRRRFRRRRRSSC